MNLQKVYSTLFISLLLTVFTAKGASPQVRWHDEDADKARITKLLTEASRLSTKPGVLMEVFGKAFLDTPYLAGTLENPGGGEVLTVDLDELDCTTFVETVTALTLTAADGRYSWHDFLDNLQRIRYRGEEPDGYASRLHYISDWVVTNTHKGNVREVTSSVPQCDYQVKTLDYMSTHRDSYPAMADSAVYERVKNMEVGFRSHRYPYVKAARAGAKGVMDALQTGDIIAFTTATPGLDVAHVGIIVREADGPHLLHASSAEGKVVIDGRPLTEYLRKNRAFNGFRVIRVVNH